MKPYTLAQISRWITPAIERKKTVIWIKFWKRIIDSEDNHQLHPHARTEIKKLTIKMDKSYKGSSTYWSKKKEEWNNV